MKSIEAKAINWDIIIKDKKDDESKENNIKYCISVYILFLIFSYII